MKYMAALHNIDNGSGKSLQGAFRSAKELERRTSSLDGKMLVWKRFLIDTNKSFSYTFDAGADGHVKVARRRLSELNDMKNRRLFKPGKRLRDFFYSREKRLQRHCALFNVEIKYAFSDRNFSRELPFEVVDVDYDNVTFNLLMETRCPGLRVSGAVIGLKAYDRDGVEIGSQVESAFPPRPDAQSVNKIYVPNAAKNAVKFTITITFAKKDSMQGLFD